MTNVEYVELFENDDGEWTWRAVAANGEVVIPPEGHRDPTDAERAARGVLGEDVEVRVLEADVDDEEVEDGPEPEEGPVEE